MPLANSVSSNQFPRRPDEQAVSGDLGGYSVKKISSQVISESAFDPAKPMRNQIEGSPLLGSRRVAVVPGPVNTELAHAARYLALPTRDQLIAKAGRPKDNITFRGVTVYRMSTGYKTLLAGLDRYQDALNKHQPVTPERLEGLLRHLQGLRKGTDRYFGSSSHTHIGEIKDLRYQIDCNIDLLEGMKKQMKDGAAWPPGTSLRQGIKFARQGVPVEDLFTSRYQNLLDSGMGVDELKPYDNLGLSGAEARLLNESGLGVEGGRMYREVNLPVTRETLLHPNFRTANETGFVELASGSLNTVYQAAYHNNELGVFLGVFKPLSRIDARVVERGLVAHHIGIDVRSPQTALRNLATVAVARKLGFNVVPDTRIAEHGGQLGILMDMAEGDTGYETRSNKRSLFKDAQVRRELTKLQLLDALVAQGDRHAKNYFIDRDETSGRVTVTGIDNDQCFGEKVVDPNDIASKGIADPRAFRGVRLPPVIDTEMADAFRRLTPDDLDNLLGGNLSSKEVDAAKQRLQGIQNHIEKLRASGHEIAPDEWGSNAVSDLLTDQNSYAARDGKRLGQW
jgi:hypothetical protein